MKCLLSTQLLFLYVPGKDLLKWVLGRHTGPESSNTACYNVPSCFCMKVAQELIFANRHYIENLLHFGPNNSRTLWVKIIWIKIQTFWIIALLFSWQTVLWMVRLSPGTHAWSFKGWSAYPKLYMLDVQTKASAYQNNQTSREYRQRPSPGQIRVFEQGLRNMLRKWISELHRSRKRHECFVHI